MAEHEWLLLGFWLAFIVAAWAVGAWARVGDESRTRNPYESK